jgi:hypothetical protein
MFTRSPDTSGLPLPGVTREIVRGIAILGEIDFVLALQELVLAVWWIAKGLNPSVSVPETLRRVP